MARLEGDGRRESILLSTHVDVVPADEEHWDHPPFGAEIHDGFIGGCKYLDMKNMAAMELAAMLLLKRSGRVLKDLIFVAVADEELAASTGPSGSLRTTPISSVLSTRF